MKINFKINNKARTTKLESRRGFMMVEIIVASSIMLISILAVMAVAQKSVVLSERSIHTAQANFLLEEGAEAVRILRDNNWTNISGLSQGTHYSLSFSSNTWNISNIGTPEVVGKFSRIVDIFTVNRDATTADIVTNGGVLDNGTKLITITVTWPEGGQTLSKTFKFYLSDIF